MSVSLTIKYRNGAAEDVPLAPQKTAEALCHLAATLGLKHAQYFYSFYAVEPTELDEVIEELRILHGAIRERGTNWLGPVGNLERILEALDRLKGEQGWTASFG